MDNRPILICYDGSVHARRAIATAAALLGPREAVVLDVAPYLTPAESLAVVSAPIGFAEFEDLNAATALERADEGVRVAAAAGFTAEPRTTFGAPTWQGVVDVADELDVAVIVIGSRGLNGARERLEGSLSHEIAAHAGRPVLISPPPQGNH
jgi:nucleotide-binding universal stress UspA family protein